MNIICNTAFKTCLCYVNRATWLAGRCREASEAAAWPSSSRGTHAKWWRGPEWWDTCPYHSTPPGPPGPLGYSKLCKTADWEEEGCRSVAYDLSFLTFLLLSLVKNTNCLKNSQGGSKKKPKNKQTPQTQITVQFSIWINHLSFMVYLTAPPVHFITTAFSSRFSVKLWNWSSIHNPISLCSPVG